MIKIKSRLQRLMSQLEGEIELEDVLMKMQKRMYVSKYQTDYARTVVSELRGKKFDPIEIADRLDRCRAEINRLEVEISNANVSRIKCRY